MRKTALLILLNLCVVSTIKSQIKEGDFLINRSVYDNLKTYKSLFFEREKEVETLRYKLDSIMEASSRILDRLERTEKREGSLSEENQHLKQVNHELGLRNKTYRSQALDWRFKYNSSPRFKEKSENAIVWAGVMTASFFFALSDDAKKEMLVAGAVVVAGAVTLYLAIGLNKGQKKIKGQGVEF